MELHDIFPEVVIVEYSVYAFVAMGLLGLALLSLLYHIRKHRASPMHPLQILERYNPDDAKQTAQQISYYGKQLAKREAQKQHLTALEEKLSTYKYLQISPPLPETLQKEIERFIKHMRHPNA